MSRKIVGPIVLIGEFEPNRPCIYQIHNTRNGKRYIGSCLSVTKRLGVHNANLRKGKASPYLQNEYDKYHDMFQMTVLEHCLESDILEREQFWLDKSYDNQKQCYNINPRAYSNLGLKLSDATKKKLSASKTKISLELIDPAGNLVNVVGVKKFCAENGIYEAHLLQLRKGKVKTCKGWRLASDKDKSYMVPQAILAEKLRKTYDVKLVDPNNNEYGPITNLRAFCREHKLNRGNFKFLLNGAVKTCQGWRLLENKHLTRESIEIERILKISNTYDVKVQAPTNEVFGPIKNLNQFCKEHGLSQSSMDALIKGKAKTYKGWKLLEEKGKNEDVSTVMHTSSSQ